MQDQNKDNIIERCSNCKCIPDDILMLACDHDLCLNCSSIQYNATKINQVLRCQQCNIETNLDKDTCFELEKMLANSFQKQNFNKNLSISKSFNLQQHQTNTSFCNGSTKMTPAQKLGFPSNKNSFVNQQLQQHNQSVFSNYNNNNSITNNQTNNYNQLQTQSQRHMQNQNLRQYCRQHPEEEVMYFCFDCETECMCAECVIHGPHKDHEVKTLKKSFPIIKETIQSFLATINQQTIKINGQKDQYTDCKKQLRENNKFMQESISKNFEDLQLKISLKEKELLQNCQNMYEQNLDQIDTFTSQLNSQIDQFQNQYDFLTEHLKVQSEFELLNFYSENLNELKQIGEIKEIQNMKNEEQLQNQIKLEYNFDDIQNQFLKISQQVLDFKPQILKKCMLITQEKHNMSIEIHQKEMLKKKILKELAEKENYNIQNNQNSHNINSSFRQSLQKLKITQTNNKNQNIYDDDIESDAQQFRKQNSVKDRQSSRLFQQINLDSMNNQSQIPFQQDSNMCLSQQDIPQNQRIPTYSDI